jgi:predicted alpha/beta-hydrolase family hydrolase
LAANLDFLFDGPAKAATTIALAHSAGAGMDSPFMEFFAKRLSKRGFRVVRFNYPYMTARLVTGKAKPPDREPVLRETWLNVIEKLGPKGLVFGGKSMGGRIASLVADEVGVAGLVCLGYPFHPVGKPDKLWVEHLKTIKTSTLIVQGERDPFGIREEVAGYKLSKKVRVAWMMDGAPSPSSLLAQCLGNMISIPYLGATASILSIPSLVGGGAGCAPAGSGTPTSKNICSLPAVATQGDNGPPRSTLLIRSRTPSSGSISPANFSDFSSPLGHPSRGQAARAVTAWFRLLTTGLLNPASINCGPHPGKRRSS